VSLFVSCDADAPFSVFVCEQTKKLCVAANSPYAISDGRKE
jgi:hypothetical protein